MRRQLPRFSMPHFHIGGQRGVAHYVKSCWLGSAYTLFISLACFGAFSLDKMKI